MHLPAQSFAQVVEALRAGDQAGAGSEKRRAPRMSFQAAIVVWPLVNGACGKAFTALTRDISSSGIGLFQTRRIASAERFLVGLPRGRLEPLIVMCEARYVTEPADGLVSVGAEFLQALGSGQRGAAGPATQAAPPAPVEARG